MKQLLCMVFLGLFVGSVSAFEINAGVSGSWFNPNRNGHGFAIEYTEQPGACEQINNQGCLVVYWFVYDEEGNPIFLLGILPVDGNIAEGEMLYFSGQSFGAFSPVPVQMSWGSLRLRFSDCDSGFASYESGFVPPEGAAFDNEGQFPITRLASVGSLSCDKAGRLQAMPDFPAGGVWLGNAISRGFTEDSNALQSRSIAAIVLDDGEAFLFMPEPSVYRGTLSGEDIDVSGTLKAYAGFPAQLFNGRDTGQSKVTVAGAATLEEISEPDRTGMGNAGDYLEGHFDGAGIEGDFTLKYQGSSSRPSDMGRIARCWLPEANTGQSAGPFAIKNDGGFSVTFSDGCRFEGSVSNDLAPWNVYRMSGEITECDFAGSYDGVAAILDRATGDNSQMLFGVDNGTYSLSGVAVRLNDNQCQ